VWEAGGVEAGGQAAGEGSGAAGEVEGSRARRVVPGEW